MEKNVSYIFGISRKRFYKWHTRVEFYTTLLALAYKTLSTKNNLLKVWTLQLFYVRSFSIHSRENNFLKK